MKIAVTYENGKVFQHFGHTESFKLYEVEEGKIISSAVLPTLGSGHGALAGFLAAQGVDTLLCGGIGGGAREALGTAGIRLFPGVQGDADQSVVAFLAGTLQFDPAYLCTHHEEGHSCGEHSCGDAGHSCHGEH